jgi:hypothetical protein
MNVNAEYSKKKALRWLHLLRQREFVTRDGTVVKLWQPKTKLPKETADLSPNFRSL